MASGTIQRILWGGSRSDPGAGRPRRTLFAIAHIDMVGYSCLIGLDDTGTVERLRALRRDFIDPTLRRHGGELVQTAGDSLLVTFDSVVKAVNCSVDLQRGMPFQNSGQPRDYEMLFRIGVEIGDILTHGVEFHGDGVNVAARLQVACPPGGICVSRAVHDQVNGRLDDLDVTFQELGPLALKNIARPVDALIVLLTPSASGERESDAPHRPYPAVREGPPRIAVLPFQHLDDAPASRHISDGLAADIVCQLTGLRELSVISHGSTQTIQDTTADPRDIGQRLGARYIVRGSLRRVATRTRLTAELTLASNGEVIWGNTVDMTDPLSFDVQDNVVARIVNRLTPHVREAELQRIRGRRPDALSSYEKVLLAREAIMRLERERFMEAKALLDDVIAREPDYAEAYALASDWHALMLGQDWSDDKDADVAAVDRLARKALTLDDGNVRALVSYGHRRSLLHRDYPAAMRMFERALEVAPGAAQAWLKSSYTYAWLGNADEAMQRAGRATDLSPCDQESHLFYSAHCVAHYTAGDYDTAAEWGLRAVSEKTMLRTTAGWAAASLVAAGRVDEAKELAAQTMAQWPERRVSAVVARHPYRDAARRQRYGEHLRVAGFP